MSHPIYRYSVLLLTIWLSAACGGPAIELSPTPLPRATATPISTPLPDVATAVPAGFPDNPVRMIIVPVDREAAEASEEQLEQAILSASSVTVDVQLAERQSEALAALCDASLESASVAWLEGLSLAAALSRNCGEAILALHTGRGSAMRQSETARLIFNRALGTTELTVLRGRVFCRIGVDDLYSWLLPTLIFRSNRVNPADFGEIIEYPDQQALVQAVADGECAGAGVPGSLWEHWEAQADPILDDLRLSSATLEIPYGALLYPANMPLAARLSLTEGLLRLAVLQEMPIQAAADADAADADAADADAADADAADADAADADAADADAADADAADADAADADAADTDAADADAAEDAQDDLFIEPGLLAPFFGERSWVRVTDPEQYSVLLAFFDEIGLNLELLGN